MLIFFFYISSFLFGWGLLYFVYFPLVGWGGGFTVFDGDSSTLLFYLCALVYWMTYLVERSLVIFRFSSWLVLFCVLFFTSGSLLQMFMLLESTLIPLLFLVLAFGSQSEKVQASYYLIFYSLFCGIPFLVFYSTELGGDSPFFLLSTRSYSEYFLLLVSMVFFMKFPLFSLHLWLPKLHVESPTSGSVLLACLLLKMGTYGFTRFLGGFMGVPSDLLLFLCLLGFVFVSFYCCFLSDIKLVIAYSSVVHMNLLLFVLLTGSCLGVSSALLLMVSHGIVSSLMFYLSGEWYGFLGTRLVYHTSGMWLIAPSLSFLSLLLFLSNAGVPPFLGFFGEVLSVGTLFYIYPFFWGFLLVYFLLTLYYSLSLIMSVVVGGGQVVVSLFPFPPLFFLFLISFLLAFL